MSEVARRLGPAPVSGIEEAIAAIREKAGAIRFGTITLTLHEGRATQLEVAEKTRFQP